MRIKKGFELRDVCGQKTIIAQGIENLNFCSLVTLNESAAYLWNKVVGRDFSESVLAECLMDEYEISAEQATQDAKELAAQWLELGIAE